MKAQVPAVSMRNNCQFMLSQDVVIIMMIIIIIIMMVMMVAMAMIIMIMMLMAMAMIILIIMIIIIINIIKIIIFLFCLSGCRFGEPNVTWCLLTNSPNRRLAHRSPKYGQMSSRKIWMPVATRENVCRRQEKTQKYAIGVNSAPKYS